jgi:hypothetical protein
MRYLLVISVALCLISLSCNKTEQLDSKTISNLYPSFIETGEYKGCHCYETTAYFARGERGLLPISRDRSNINNSDELKLELKPQIISLQNCIQELQRDNVGPIPMRVLVHKKGHFYGLLGTIEINDVRFFQLIHGGSQVWLATSEQLERAGFIEVWKLGRTSSEIPIPVGKNVLWVDNLYHNFGEVKPASEVTGVFNFRNGGDKTLILSKPETSCGCIVPNIDTATKIESGKSFLLKISLISSQSISTRQTVGMKCYEEGSGILQQFTLDLFANQRESMEIVPKSLDFGFVTPHEEVKRTVTLKEVPTDRFSISKINFGNLPLTCAMQEMTALDGMKYYQTELRFLLKNEKIEGKQRDEIVFITDSHQFPQIKIPVTYEVAPIVQAIPSIVSFGTVRVGEKNRTEVKFESRNGYPVEVILESLPEGITFEKSDKVYHIDFVPKKIGIWENEMKLILVAGSCQFPCSLKCVAFVQEINK